MKLSCCTDVLGNLPFETMLDHLKSVGILAVEMTTGGWSSAPHVNMEELLEDVSARTRFQSALKVRGMEIAALNCSGNPLDPSEMGLNHKDVAFKTMVLAGLLGVKKIVMMSGLPPATPEDKVPNWITYTVSWPPVLKDMLNYQWNEVAIPFWKELVVHAKENGVEKIALENFSSQLVYNPETLFRLRNAVDPMIGLNLDPSHLIWMGACLLYTSPSPRDS